MRVHVPALADFPASDILAGRFDVFARRQNALPVGSQISPAPCRQIPQAWLTSGDCMRRHVPAVEKQGAEPPSITSRTHTALLTRCTAPPVHEGQPLKDNTPCDTSIP